MTNNVSLDGTLDIALLDSFVPNYGDTFEVLTYDGSRSGVFSEVTGHIISPILALGQFYDDVDGALTLLATAPGDANGDLIVNAFDFGLLAANFNLPGTWQTGDFNGDGTTNAFDFGLLAANFNGDFSALASAADALGITTIPEPGTLGLLVASVAVVCGRRRNWNHTG